MAGLFLLDVGGRRGGLQDRQRTIAGFLVSCDAQKL